VTLRIGLRVAVWIEVRRRLRQSRQERGLGDRQLREVADPEVDPGGRREAVRVMAVEDLVEIGSDDLLLACLARIRSGQTRRLDQLLRLAQVAIGPGRDHVLRQKPSSNQLLGDRRGATIGAIRGVAGGSRHDRRGIEAAVLPEGPILGRRRRIQDESRHFAEYDDAPLLALEPAELNRAGPVVDDGRLGERQRSETRRIGKVLRQGADHRDGSDRGSAHEQARPDDQGKEGADQDRRDATATRRRMPSGTAEHGSTVGDPAIGDTDRRRPTRRTRSGHGELAWDWLVHGVRIEPPASRAPGSG